MDNFPHFTFSNFNILTDFRHHLRRSKKHYQTKLQYLQILFLEKLDKFKIQIKYSVGITNTEATTR